MATFTEAVGGTWWTWGQSTSLWVSLNRELSVLRPYFLTFPARWPHSAARWHHSTWPPGLFSSGSQLQEGGCSPPTTLSHPLARIVWVLSVKKKEMDSLSPAPPSKSLQDPAYQPTGKSPVVGRKDGLPPTSQQRQSPRGGVGISWGPLPSLSVLPGYLFAFTGLSSFQLSVKMFPLPDRGSCQLKDFELFTSVSLAPAYRLPL